MRYLQSRISRKNIACFKISTVCFKEGNWSDDTFSFFSFQTSSLKHGSAFVSTLIFQSHCVCTDVRACVHVCVWACVRVWCLGISTGEMSRKRRRGKMFDAPKKKKKTALPSTLRYSPFQLGLVPIQWCGIHSDWNLCTWHTMGIAPRNSPARKQNT